MALARTDTSILGLWWWTVDRWLVLCVLALVAVGILMIGMASPPVAQTLGLPPMHFLQRHLIFLVPSLAAMFAVSLLTPRLIRIFALLGMLGSLVLLAATPILGTEIKGATRWLSLGGYSLQPSEFAKPFLAVTTAWLFCCRARDRNVPGNAMAVALVATVAALLLAQPDLGMTVLVVGAWCVQFFLAGLPMYWVAGMLVLGVAGLAAAYVAFPHVADRIDQFANPASGNTYQIEQALQAFERGGLFGMGPGEGAVKTHLPDAHADFIFAVAGEELGLLACLLLVALYGAYILRGFARAQQSGDLFVLLATGGLLVQFGGQALINMGSALHLIPTKGMTLPFISYGGSSLLALSIATGMILALTRRRASDSDGATPAARQRRIGPRRRVGLARPWPAAGGAP